MKPVVTPARMSAIDAMSPVPVPELIERAGWAVAVAARRLLGDPRRRPRSVGGRRVLVVAGPGNNGADGRVAARILDRWGARCVVVMPDEVADGLDARLLERTDLLIDAAFGTGLRRPFAGGAISRGNGSTPPVLAVDIPSGIDGSTGESRGSVWPAAATVTFGAHKPGLLIGDGPRLCGEVTVAGLGLDCSGTDTMLLDATDLAGWPERRTDTHKWKSAVWVVGGSPPMIGAPQLTARGAGRAGAGYVLVSVPGLDPASHTGFPMACVPRPLGSAWASELMEQLGRVSALVIGPGLPTDSLTGDQVRAVIRQADIGLVLDAGALDAVADDPTCLQGRRVPAVLTPHDGEFARLWRSSHKHGPHDRGGRIEETRRAAAELGAVVVRKGPTTVVAQPDGTIRLSRAGDARLATAGTGDVLAGVIAAGLARGLDPLAAASLGVEAHGRAARLGPGVGMVSDDLPDLVAQTLTAASRGGDRSPSAMRGRSGQGRR